MAIRGHSPAPRTNRRVLWAVLLIGGILSGALAGAADLHVLWDQQCGGCHGHAGQFARKSLQVTDGRLAGRIRGEGLAVFLEKHNGGYPPETIRAMTSMLQAQVETPDLFGTMCRDCHGLAAQFVREMLIRRDGTLYGRYSHRDIGEFLRTHRNLDDEQASLMLGVLNRIEREVHHPR